MGSARAADHDVQVRKAGRIRAIARQCAEGERAGRLIVRPPAQIPHKIVSPAPQQQAAPILCARQLVKLPGVGGQIRERRDVITQAYDLRLHCIGLTSDTACANR